MGSDPQSLEKVDDVLQDVMDWGKYDAAAYRVLVDEGPLEAKEIVVRTDIPQGRIYDVLNSLDRDGVVEKREANPARYRAADPGRLLGEKQGALEETKETLVTAFELDTPTRSAAADEAWVLGGLAGTVRKVREHIENAEESVLGVERDPKWYETNDMRLLRRHADNDLDVRLVVWNARQSEFDALKDQQVPVWKHESATKSFYVIDEEYVILRLRNQDSGIVFRDKPSASIFMKEFEELYSEATEVEDNE